LHDAAALISGCPIVYARRRALQCCARSILVGRWN